MKKESFTSFMKQVAVDLQQSGNLGLLMYIEVV